MEFLRTPDHRFKNLPDYDYSPNYVEVSGGLRMHYVDANPDGEKVVVLLHGEPDWCYLYRKMIAGLSTAGFRVIAPDLIGFGRSDKPVNESDYSYGWHVNWVKELLFDHLDLTGIHLFVQDWGGLIGLRLLADNPARFAAVAAANTFLPTGDQDPGPGFHQWLAMSKTLNPFPIGDLLQMGTVTKLTDAELAAYDAPFPDESYKAGARIFPQLVPITPNDPASPANREAWQRLMQLNVPFLTLFSDKDPITKGAEKYLQDKIPGAKGQPHQILANGGHFLQEDCGEELVVALVAFFG
ncbi:haloalkane dehalogenase [Neolewinella persica]|uniref:haloalkane dehalogenase n=1 Tax=Neolewinella persica TaxID=70998 RepID=UPI0003624455|nr:haloalkane dehalogenase [Neolewinella persica]